MYGKCIDNFENFQIQQSPANYRQSVGEEARDYETMMSRGSYEEGSNRG